MSIAERAVADLLPALQPSVEASGPLGNLAPLPRDLLLYLLSFLDFKNLMTVSLLSKNFKAVAEDKTTVLGKVKRAYRVFNGQAEVKLLSPDRNCTFVTEPGRVRCYLMKRENGKTIKLEQPTSRNYSKPIYSVSPTLFVYRDNGKWGSYLIDYEIMSIISAELPAFPSITQEPDEMIKDHFQEENFLYLEIRSAAAAASHFLTYVIDETKGPNSLYVGQPEQHVICHWQTNAWQKDEVTSIESIEKKDGQEIVKWSRILSIDQLQAKIMRGKWLVLQSDSSGESNFYYHFLDVNSGQKIYTYDPLKDRNNPYNVTLYVIKGGFFLKNNICIITDHFSINYAGAILLLEEKKSIPLSYRTMELLTSIPREKRCEKIEKINWDNEKGLFEIEGTRHDYRIQIRFSGNPLVPLATSSYPPPYPHVFDALMFIWKLLKSSIVVVSMAAIVVGCLALLSFLRWAALKEIWNKANKEFQKIIFASK